MGRRGPAPKPTMIQMLKGDPGKRAKKRLGTEPRPPRSAGGMSCPKMLDAEGKKEWRRVIKLFGKMEAEGQKILTDADRGVLAGYCQAWSDLCRANERIQRMGEVVPIKDAAGNIKYLQQNPYVAMKNKALIALAKYAGELGLSPAARARVKIEAPAAQKADRARDIIGF